MQARQRRGEPAISVDTKKKEVLAASELKQPGKTYRPQGDPLKVKTHDFPDPELGKAVPSGVYDIHQN